MIVILTFILFVSCGNQNSGNKAIFEDQDILVSNDSVGSYAIPNIVATPKGTILAFATARYGNNHDWGNVQKAVVIRSTDNGLTWSLPRVIAEIPEWTVRQTSAIVEPESGKIFVFGHKAPRHNAKGEMITERWNIANQVEMEALGAGHYFVCSEDEGETWTGMQSIDLPYWPHDVGITLRYGKYKGRLILPARFTKGKRLDWPNMFNGVLISDDKGDTWRAGGLTQSHVGEACVVELSDGRVYVNSRNHAANFGIRNHAISYDGGETFTEFGDDPELIEPTCDAGMVRYNDPSVGNVILFSNPSTSARKRWDGGSRHRMTVRGSYDNGETWPLKRLIFAGPSAYSGLAIGKEGMIFLIYERAKMGSKNSRENLAIARFNLAWLEQAEVDAPVILPQTRIFNPKQEISLSGDDNSLFYYTTDGSKPNEDSNLYEHPFVITENSHIRVIAISRDHVISIETQAKFSKSLHPAPVYISAHSPRYPASGAFALVDGLRGTMNYHDGLWQGFEENDMTVIIDLLKNRKVREVGVSCLQSTDFWVFYPSYVTVEISDDGKNFKILKTIKNEKTADGFDRSRRIFSANLENIKGRYLRLRAKNIGICPKWHKGAGGKAWLFVDEVIVK